MAAALGAWPGRGGGEAPSVAALVRLRGSGELTREQFFGALAALQAAEAAAAPPAAAPPRPGAAAGGGAPAPGAPAPWDPSQSWDPARGGDAAAPAWPRGGGAARAAPAARAGAAGVAGGLRGGGDPRHSLAGSSSSCHSSCLFQPAARAGPPESPRAVAPRAGSPARRGASREASREERRELRRHQRQQYWPEELELTRVSASLSRRGPEEPSSLSPRSPSLFLRRGELWRQQHEYRLHQMRRQREAQERELCPFHPVVDSAAPPRAADAGVPRRALATQEWCEQREASQRRACTFRPDTSQSFRSLAWTRGRPAPQSAEGSLLADEPGGLASAVGCCPDGPGDAPSPCPGGPAHVPRTNDVREDMLATRAYLQHNVFQRLSQTNQIDPAPDSCCGGGWRDSARPSQRPQTAPRASLRRSRSEAELRGAPGEAAWERFLDRTSRFEQERSVHLHQLRASTAPSLAPELDEHSRRLAERRRRRAGEGAWDPWESCGGGSTAAGSSGGSGSRPAEAPRSAASGEGPPFAPRICDASRGREPKGPEQMSTGEAQRRAERTARLRQEAETRAEVPAFAPHVTDYQGIGGRLRVLEDPGGLLERIAEQRRGQEERLGERRRQLQAAEDQRLTFRPEVREAPPLVRRMAASHRLLREKENIAQAQLPCPPKWV